MKENWEINWKDYYKILQVQPLAEPEVIKAAFDRLARKYHPDVNKEPRTLDRMKDLNEAFEILGNPLKRATYDTKYNQKEETYINPISSSYTSKSEVKANTNATHDTTQSIMCVVCKRKTNMLIAFVDKKPAYGTCPICHNFWDLKAYFNSQSKPNTNPRPYPKREE